MPATADTRSCIWAQTNCKWRVRVCGHFGISANRPNSAWVVNTELQEFDVESIKKDLEGDNRGKKSLALWNAYQVAAQEHDLEWYKNMLVQHEKEVIELMEAEAKAETERNEKMREKEEKKKARLSKSGKDGEGDVDMEGAGGAAPKKKVERKRKKSVGDAGDEDKVRLDPTPPTVWIAVALSDWERYSEGFQKA